MENDLLDKYCQRPDFWSLTEWDVLRRLVADEPGAWLKPIVSDQTGGLTSRVIPVVEALLEAGLKPRRSGGRVPRSGAQMSRASVRWRHGEVWCYALRDRDELWAAIDDLPPGAGTDAVLARLNVAVPHLRSVENGATTVTLWVGVAVGADASAALHQLRAVVDACAEGLTQRDEQGFADLTDQFARAGLAVPRIPAPLVRRLRKHGEWMWSTLPADEQPQAMDDYSLSSEWLKGEVPDHVTISHAGHGINSYALSLRMAWGPVALIVQAGWGGAFGGPKDHGRLAELFAELARVVRALEDRQSQARRGPRRRTLLVEASPLRGILRVRRYDPIVQDWIAVDVDANDPWETIAELAGRLRLNP